MPNTKRTPKPWKWTTDDAGPKDEWCCATRGEIDPLKFKSSGYSNNPELWGPDFNDYNHRVLSGGGGEYTPYSNPADAVLIAAAPILFDTVVDLLDILDGISPFACGVMKKIVDEARNRAKQAIVIAGGEES